MRVRGQATAIGAVFFIMLVTVSLAYFIWTMEVMRELEHEYLSRRTARATVESERISIEGVSYTVWEPQTPSSVTVVEGTVISQTPLTIASKCYYPEKELEVVMLQDDFSDPAATGWSYRTLLESCPISGCGSLCAGDSAPCLCSYADGDYMGTFLDIRCSPSAPTQVKYWSGEWSNTISVRGYQPTKVYAYVNYTIANYAWPAFQCRANFTVDLFLKITTPSGVSKSVLISTCSGTLDPGDAIVCSNEWYQLNLTDLFAEEGIYKISITAFYTLRFRPGWFLVRCTYTGYALLSRILIIALSEIPLGPDSCRVIVDSEYPVSPDAVSGVLVINGTLESTNTDLTVFARLLAYDVGLGAWKELSLFSVERDSSFRLESALDPLEGYVTGGVVKARLVVEAQRAFNLTLNENFVNFSVISNNVNVTVVNTCGHVVRIVRVWVVNSTDVMWRDVDTVLKPGEEATLTLDGIRLEKGSSYLVRVVTERGRTYDEIVKVPGG